MACEKKNEDGWTEGWFYVWHTGLGLEMSILLPNMIMNSVILGKSLKALRHREIHLPSEDIMSSPHIVVGRRCSKMLGKCSDPSMMEGQMST